MSTHKISRELDELEREAKATTQKQPGAKKKRASAESDKPVFDSGLTPQQEAYCRGRALGMSKVEAIDMAGLTPNSTNKAWERSPDVVKRIQELSEIVTTNSIIKNGLDRGWVISRLMSVAERCMEAEPVMERDSDGSIVATGKFKFDSAGANRALELLGKTMRMFEAKDTAKHDEYANLSDDEIARIAAELATQTGLAGYLVGTEAPSGPQQVIEVQAVPSAD